MFLKKCTVVFFLFVTATVFAQDKVAKDKAAADKAANVKWFSDAKFGLFMHWGLYSNLAGTWKDKNYFGSGEWIMFRAKIPAAEYAATAKKFNPVNFNATAWAKLAKASGIRYMVITAKHHEGFSMYDSKVSDYNIVKASPYGKDPMKALSSAARSEGIQFGFYYSQYLDWHEPNGGGNDWDFKEDKKDYQTYYREKSIPQLKELLTNYGPLGIMWFDQPGGLTREQTQAMIDSLHSLQPHTLFSSRVGQGLGDYIDFGDSEVPPQPIKEPWEAIYTHNDSWGYIKHDMNFKSSKEIIQLLATTASRGGNLMLNVGPDGTGNIPYYSQKYLLQTGKWLQKYGESIYGTTYGLIPGQPWGVTTAKPGKIYLHVFTRPADGKLFVPSVKVGIKKIYELYTKMPVAFTKKNNDLYITIPALQDKSNTVYAVEYTGTLAEADVNAPLVVSSQYTVNTLNSIAATLSGDAKIESLTFSHYFGDWKNVTVISNMKQPADIATFKLNITEPGDYKILLEYSCADSSSRQEGVVEINNNNYAFETLPTSDYDSNKPLLFIKHPVATITVDKPGGYTLKIHPFKAGKDLFYLKSILVQPEQ